MFFSDVGCWSMSDVGCQMSDVGCQMSDVGCWSMSDVEQGDVGQCQMLNMGMLADVKLKPFSIV